MSRAGEAEASTIAVTRPDPTGPFSRLAHLALIPLTPTLTIATEDPASAETSGNYG